VGRSEPQQKHKRNSLGSFLNKVLKAFNLKTTFPSETWIVADMDGHCYHEVTWTGKWNPLECLRRSPAGTQGHPQS
jgi:hypothetical protein